MVRKVCKVLILLLDKGHFITGTADRRRAQWKALMRRARRGKNAEAFLNSVGKPPACISGGSINILLVSVVGYNPPLR